jgi:hypothetical protein
MTFLAKDIRDHIKGSVDCLDAFGDHIYESIIPQGVSYEAALVINIISQQPDYYLGGEVGSHQTQVQLDVYTNGQGSAVRANEVAELVRNRLSGYRGQLGEGCFCSNAMLRSGEADPVPAVDGSDLHKRRVRLDFEIRHTADVPTFA